ncbi:hypothetical protein ACFQHO_13290 [Actinomadura yumaensis]
MTSVTGRPARTASTIRASRSAIRSASSTTSASRAAGTNATPLRSATA